MACVHNSQSHRSGACFGPILSLVPAVLCAIGIAATWLLLGPSYEVSGAIRVDPVVSNIITGQENGGGISNYTNFVATQAMIVASPKVIEGVAKDLAGKGLKFFEKRPGTTATKIGFGRNENDSISDPYRILKGAVLDKTITVKPVPRGELIKVSMRWGDAEEAKKIVDSFIRNYMSLEVNSASDEDEQQLALLQNEQKRLSSKMQDYRVQIDRMAEEYPKAIDAGQKNLAMQALQDELVLTKKMYDTISLRIQEFKMERKRPARISVACKADITETHDIRGHYTVALLIGFLVFGILSLLLQRR
jgi:capsular polysaccharide biosynthesis protein